VTTDGNAELVATSESGLTLDASGAHTSIRLNPDIRRKVTASLDTASERTTKDRVFLKLEGVRGNFDSAVLDVYINLPEGADPRDHQELLLGSVGLFGLKGSSRAHGENAGKGLSFVLEIGKVFDTSDLKDILDADLLHVSIVPHNALPQSARITIQQVCIYRLGR